MTSAFDAWRFAEINKALYTLSVVVLVTLVLVTVVLFIVSVVIVVGFLIVVVIIVFFIIACFSMRHALISVACCIIGHIWIWKRRTQSLDNQVKRLAIGLVHMTLPTYRMENTIRRVG